MAALREVLVQSVLIVLLLGSLAGVVIGVTLIVRSEATLNFFRRMNRWFTTRVDQKAREEHPVPGTSTLTATQRRVAGAVFAVAGGFAAIVLVTTPKIPAAALIQARSALWALSFLFADFLRWFLALGCAGAAVVGILLLFFPQSWARLEARANRWHSTHQFFATADAMHMPLDRWIERSPRPAGALLTLLSLVAVAAFATLLLWRK